MTSPLREAIADAVEALIGVLDMMDSDPESEAEEDVEHDGAEPVDFHLYGDARP